VASVPQTRQKVFAGTRFDQFASTRVAGALALDQRLGRGAHDRFGTQGGTPDTTIFVGLLRPRFRVAGSAERLRFRLLDASSEFVTNARALRREITTPDLLRSSTAESMLAQYVTDEAALTSPRYQLRHTVQAPIRFVEEAGNEPAQRVDATVKSTIVAQTGFDGTPLQDTLAVGAIVDLGYSSVQEDSSGLLMIVDGTEATSTPTNRVYWDAVFKTFVFVPPQ